MTNIPSIKKDAPIRASFEKIIVNTGIGRLSQLPQFTEKILPEVIRDIALITGQKPSPRPSRKSIAGFKIREGQVIGLKVTLRKKRMEDFFRRMIWAALPRVKDFRGLYPAAVDQGGMLNIGFRDQYVFPEIDPEESLRSFALQVTVVPKDHDRKAAIALYRALGVPLRVDNIEKVKDRK